MNTGKHIFFAVLGWTFPGLGHYLRGERLKGVLFCVTLLGCLLAGEIMSDFRSISRSEHDIAFWAQIGIGIPTLCFVHYDNRKQLQEQNSNRIAPDVPVDVSPLLDCGIMYTCVAGLLNFVLICDLLFPLRERGKND